MTRHLLRAEKREFVDEDAVVWDIIFYNEQVDQVEKIRRVQIDMDTYYNTDIEEQDDTEVRSEVSSGDVEKTVL